VARAEAHLGRVPAKAAGGAPCSAELAVCPRLAARKLEGTSSHGLFPVPEPGGREGGALPLLPVSPRVAPRREGGGRHEYPPPQRPFDFLHPVTSP